MLAKWLERPPREQEVMGSIPGHHSPKSLKMEEVAFPLGAQDYGIALRLACQCWDNGLVKYWLKKSPGNMDL